MFGRILIPGAAAGGGGGFDPTTLGLTLFERDYGGASPWPGTASAGISGSHNLSDGTHPPNGATVGGKATADFNGTSHFLVTDAATSTLGTFFNATGSYSGWALVNIDLINTNNPSWAFNDQIIATASSGYFGIYLKDDGAGTVKVGHGAATSLGDKTVEETFTTGAWHLVQFRQGVSQAEIRVDSGLWQTTPSSGPASYANAVEIGTGAGGQYMDGRIAEIGLIDSRLADADFNNIKSYINSRYGLVL